VKTDGGAEAGPGAKVLAELAGLIADGHLEVPIANVYPLAQVREAALQVLAGLDEGEAFNVILYNEGVEPFANRPVRNVTPNSYSNPRS